MDYQGTVNLVTAAKEKGVKKIVLVTSIGTDEPFFPLNLLWGVLFWKKRAEEAVQRSGIEYTIVRPGETMSFCCWYGYWCSCFRVHHQFTASFWALLDQEVLMWQVGCGTGSQKVNKRATS